MRRISSPSSSFPVLLYAFYARLAGPGLAPAVAAFAVAYGPARMNTLGVIAGLSTGFALLAAIAASDFLRHGRGRSLALFGAALVAQGLFSLYGIAMGLVFAVPATLIVSGKDAFRARARWDSRQRVSAAFAFSRFLRAVFADLARPSERYRVCGPSNPTRPIFCRSSTAGSSADPFATRSERLVPGFPSGPPRSFRRSRSGSPSSRGPRSARARGPQPWLGFAAALFVVRSGPTIRSRAAPSAPGPYRLVTGLPGFSSLRGIDRFDQWFDVALGAAAVLALGALSRPPYPGDPGRVRVPRSSRRVARGRAVHALPRGVRICGPARRSPANATVAVYPWTRSTSTQGWIDQLHHGRRVVNGWFSYTPATHAWADRRCPAAGRRRGRTPGGDGRLGRRRGPPGCPGSCRGGRRPAAPARAGSRPSRNAAPSGSSGSSAARPASSTPPLRRRSSSGPDRRGRLPGRGARLSVRARGAGGPRARPGRRRFARLAPLAPSPARRRCASRCRLTRRPEPRSRTSARGGPSDASSRPDSAPADGTPERARTSRSRSFGSGSPVASHIFGNIEIGVNPGSELISLRRTRCVPRWRKKSTRAKPSPPRTSNARAARLADLLARASGRSAGTMLARAGVDVLVLVVVELVPRTISPGSDASVGPPPRPRGPSIDLARVDALSARRARPRRAPPRRPARGRLVLHLRDADGRAGAGRLHEDREPQTSIRSSSRCRRRAAQSAPRGRRIAPAGAPPPRTRPS